MVRSSIVKDNYFQLLGWRMHEEAAACPVCFFFHLTCATQGQVSPTSA